MFNPKKLEEIAKQVGDVMPAGVKNFGEDVDRKIKQVLQAQLGKLDMVSREEFDVQTHVLLRTREKLAAMEAKIAEFEAKLASTEPLTPQSLTTPEALTTEEAEK